VVTVRFTMQRDEFVRAMRGYILRTPLFQGLGLVTVVVLAAALVLGDGPAAAVFATVAAFEAVMVAAFPRGMWRRAESFAGNELTYAFGPEGFGASGAGVHSDVPWTFVTRMKVVGSMYMLVTQTRQQVLVPARAFASPDDERTFNELVADNVRP
jgi:YcxB-like protein